MKLDFSTKVFPILLLLLFSPQIAHSQPRTFLLDSDALVRVKQKITEKKEPFEPAFKALIQEAEHALSAGPFSVVNKTVTPPSGDKHDYYSYGTYWWPDPSKPHGLPYIRKDGQVNPETQSDKFDDQSMEKMANTVETLALAFWFSDNEQYAHRALELLRTWFLRQDTRMNPHLEYGQAIPGRVTGRGIGIIETVRLKQVVDAARLLESSKSFASDDREGLREWFQAYLTWLRTSQHGKDEDNWYNNHGSWYDVQVSMFALFLEQDSLARQVIEASKHRRIEKQVRPDGSQPKELERTKSLSYSLYNLTALFDLATLGQHVGVDLWHYRSPEGINLKAALDYLLPFYQGKAWPFEQITPVETTYERLIALLKRAEKTYKETRYSEVLNQLPVNLSADRVNLFYPQ